MKRAVLVVCGLTVLGVLASGLLYYFIGANKPQTVVSNETFVEKPKPHIETITLTAAGDCLMHNTQISAGRQSDGTYNFDSYFKEVEHLLKEGDYTSVCFEAPLAGPETGYTGYPVFNSPDEIANTFKKSGFDLIVTANNHIMDRGIKGALRTMQIYKDVGLDTVGTYMTEEDSRQFLIKDIKGVKVGYLGYSYSTNGIPIPNEYSYFFNFLEKDKIIKDVKNLRPQVDVIIVMLHWGVEYSTKPTQEQMILAREILSAGADAILGSHPHVIQPMEVIDINGKKKFVAYSMGNFISHQRGVERNSGIVLKLKFTKNFDEGITELKEVSYTPTFSHHYYDNGKMGFRVVPVKKTLEKIMTGQDPYLGKEHIPILEKILETTTTRLGEPYFAGENIKEE